MSGVLGRERRRRVEVWGTLAEDFPGPQRSGGWVRAGEGVGCSGGTHSKQDSICRIKKGGLAFGDVGEHETHLEASGPENTGAQKSGKKGFA